MPLQSMRIDSADAIGTPLRRLQVLANSDASEKTLQDLLFRNPKLLGLDSVDTKIDQLIPVVQELQTTNAGRIDNLYVDGSGRLTIVETKLRRNPQAHREVISQIVEYAVDLSGWSYDELNRAVGETRADRRDLNAIVRERLPDDDSLARFQRRLEERLPSGDFELLVVGDRISDRALRLSEAIGATPSLRFRLSLIELEIYVDGAGDWPWIIVPRLVERMIDKERFVVRIEQVGSGNSIVRVDTSKPRGDGGDEKSAADKGGRVGDAESFFTSADLPAGFGEIFRAYSERWKIAGGELSPSSRLFRWTWNLAGETNYVLVCTTAYIQLNRSVELDDAVDLSPVAFSRYHSAIARVPKAAVELARGGRRVAFEEINSDELKILLDATLALADDLRRPVD